MSTPLSIGFIPLVDAAALIIAPKLPGVAKPDTTVLAKLNADLETIRSHYLNRGYLEFNVTSTQVTISPDKQSISIAITVRPLLALLRRRPSSSRASLLNARFGTDRATQMVERPLTGTGGQLDAYGNPDEHRHVNPWLITVAVMFATPALCQSQYCGPVLDEMLAQAVRRRQEGDEVLVGVVETHGRKETEALVEALNSGQLLVVAPLLVGIGLFFLPVDLWIKGYLSMGTVSMLGAAFTLAKTVRDEQEAKRFSNRIEDAKAERLLMEVGRVAS